MNAQRLAELKSLSEAVELAYRPAAKLTGTIERLENLSALLTEGKTKIQHVEIKLHTTAGEWIYLQENFPHWPTDPKVSLMPCLGDLLGIYLKEAKLELESMT